MKIKLLNWTLVILWMALIFFLSYQSAVESSELSSGITKRLHDLIKVIASDINLDQGSINHIIRKLAHFFIYLILGLLVANAITSSNIPNFKLVLLAFIICILYAISDEIHQLFVPGRSGCFR